MVLWDRQKTFSSAAPYSIVAATVEIITFKISAPSTRRGANPAGSRNQEAGLNPIATNLSAIDPRENRRAQSKTGGGVFIMKSIAELRQSEYHQELGRKMCAAFVAQQQGIALTTAFKKTRTKSVICG